MEVAMNFLKWSESVSKAVLMLIIGLVIISISACVESSESKLGSGDQHVEGYQVVPIAENILAENLNIWEELPKVDLKEYTEIPNSEIAPESIVVPYKPTEQMVKDMMFNVYDFSTARIIRTCFRTTSAMVVKSPFSNQCCHRAECCVVTWRWTGGVPFPVFSNCVPGYVDCIVNSTCTR
jgi:hypothetical protein